MELFTCRGCRHRFVHRSSLNRHIKKCKKDEIMWRCLTTKAKVNLGKEDPGAKKPPLPRAPKKRGRPPHILSRCLHCPRTFETAEKKRDHQRYCLIR